ncbi:MAG: ATP-grasp domain-containing protein [Actinomycetota bacterium]|nr:ATP-grasp domain-containing protein [Actinomycetota bacterium]
MTGERCTIAQSIPALILKIGNYPLHHGGVGAIRSLGRLGVPVYAITEDRFTPAASSRYLRGRFVWPTTGLEDIEQLVERLRDIGCRIGRPTVLIPTDEEAAVLAAEHAAVLGDLFRFPRMRDPGLVRRLASKQVLHELCIENGVPSPTTAFPESFADVEQFAADARFPVVVKNREAFLRRKTPAVPGTTRVADPRELLALAREWRTHTNVIIQEYLPREHAEDWIVHAYFDADSAPSVLFTGIKVRSWPPHAGMTACAYVVPNPELAEISAHFCKCIGFHGIADLDWRYDRRDSQYKLLDFNPRVGAQFRLFETEAGIDVVRAQHLDLTDQKVPVAAQRYGRRFVVENIDIPARLAYWRSGYTTPHVPTRATGTELGWFARDDLKPFFVMIARSLRPGVEHLMRIWRTHQRLTERSIRNESCGRYWRRAIRALDRRASKGARPTSANLR